MSSTHVSLPELLPILSRGKHRHPRKGACFMELASYLAGERWSDHPACTHPLLASLARSVNDRTTDANRHLLAGLIPAVIGLNSDDVRMDARIALLAARAALPVVSAERQTVMAVSILTAERVLAGLDGRPEGSLEEPSRLVLEDVPRATSAARRLMQAVGVSARGFRKNSAPHTVSTAVHGIAEACIPDPDARLRQLLADVIDACAPWRLPSSPSPADSEQWTAACRLTGAR